MTLRLALRSLATQPVRSMVLACGFGSGIAAMAGLLGIGEVILEQSRSPDLLGGGDQVITSGSGEVSSARFLLSSVLASPPLAARVEAASPTLSAKLYLVREDRSPIAVEARGGIPGLERAIGDPETRDVAAWRDTPADIAWSSPDPGDVLRAMDRFHAIPDAPVWEDSWAEWLYFNGSAGDARFYLTFLVGPRISNGRRRAGVRLHLERGGALSTYSDSAEIAEELVLAEAPDLRIGRSTVRLEGLRYRIRLELDDEAGGSTGALDRARRRPDVSGELTLQAVPGRSLAPLEVRGASGWVTGYVVPVLAGSLAGRLGVDGEIVSFDGGSGYHDHNWGFWKDVTWQWGQVASGDLSFVYGKVRPPADAADPERMPGLLAALGPEGLLGFAGNAVIEETDDPRTGQPREIVVRGSSESLELTMKLDVESAIRNRFKGADIELLQLRAQYRVVGRALDRPVEFTAAGAAETFRGR